MIRDGKGSLISWLRRQPVISIKQDKYTRTQEKQKKQKKLDN